MRSASGPEEDIVSGQYCEYEEARGLSDFRKVQIQERELCEVLRYFADRTERDGFRPSNFLEGNFEEAGLQRLVARGDVRVVEEPCGKMPPSQGNGLSSFRRGSSSVWL